MARKQKARNLKKRRSVLIGAGPTEKAYIEHLTHINGYRIETHPRFCKNDTPYYMDKFVQQAMRNAEELGTDGESYTHIPDAIRFLEKHKKK